MLLLCPWKWTLSGRRRWQTQLWNRNGNFGCGGCREKFQILDIGPWACNGQKAQILSFLAGPAQMACWLFSCWLWLFKAAMPCQLHLFFFTIHHLHFLVLHFWAGRARERHGEAQAGRGAAREDSSVAGEVRPGFLGRERRRQEQQEQLPNLQNKKKKFRFHYCEFAGRNIELNADLGEEDVVKKAGHRELGSTVRCIGGHCHGWTCDFADWKTHGRLCWRAIAGGDEVNWWFVVIEACWSSPINRKGDRSTKCDVFNVFSLLFGYDLIVTLLF